MRSDDVKGRCLQCEPMIFPNAWYVCVCVCVSYFGVKPLLSGEKKHGQQVLFNPGSICCNLFSRRMGKVGKELAHTDVLHIDELLSNSGKPKGNPCDLGVCSF